LSAHLDLVTILADDVSATVKFYTELLEFEVVEPFNAPDGSFVRLRSEKRSASLAVQDAAQRFPKITLASITEEHGGIQLGFEVEDALATRRHWESLGIELRTEMFDMQKGMTFGAKDPAGTFIQIYDVYPQFRKIQAKIGLD